MTIIKKKKKDKDSQGCEETAPLCIVVGIFLNSTATLKEFGKFLER